MNRHGTDSTTIRLDDLEPGDWYEITLPNGCDAGHDGRDDDPTKLQFVGFDGRYAWLREEGSVRSEPWPTTLLARSRITQVYAPVEIVDVEGEYVPVKEEEDDRLPLSSREKRWIVLCIIGGCAFWISLFLWAFWR